MKSENDKESYDDSTMSQEEKTSFLEQLFIPKQDTEKQRRKKLDFSGFLPSSTKSKHKKRKMSPSKSQSLQYSSLLNTQRCLFTLIALFIIFCGFLYRSTLLKLTPLLFLFYLVNLYLYKRKTPDQYHHSLFSIKPNSNEDASVIKVKEDSINESDYELEQCLLLNI